MATPEEVASLPGPTDLDAPPADEADALVDDPAWADTVEAGPFDNGKMWTFDAPPRDYLSETYGFTPDDEWFERARLGAVRIPNCSASFVSPHGLLMTNHHCARDFVVQATADGENLLDDGFYATGLEEERAVEDFDVDQLVEIHDVTTEVETALDGVADPQARSTARDSITDAIAERLLQERGGEDGGYEVEIISLYNGGLYSAYVFRRHTDVKLVMAPELRMGYFGGDDDNFTYPRYALDMAFFRVYGDGGAPLETPEHFSWSESGVAEDDLIFIIGNPGSTSRLQTVSELEFRRDVESPATLDFINRRIEALEEYLGSHGDAGGVDEVRNALFGLLNSQKAFTGIWEGLRDPYILARRADTQADFLAEVEADPGLSGDVLPLVEELETLQDRKREVAAEFAAFAGFGSPDYESSLMLRTLAAFQYFVAMQQGAGAEVTDGFIEDLRGVENRPVDLDEVLLRSRFEDMVEALGEDDASVQAVLQGRTPDGAAAALLANSLMADSAAAEDALLGGTLNPGAEPAFAMLQGMLGSFFPFQQVVAEVLPRQEEIAAVLGRARFEVYGTRVPPDATFSLRLADGLVSGYAYNGTQAPAYTTIYGLFDRHHSNPGDEAWTLPDRWLAAENLDLTTPMNFASTADIIGGNSGSPVVNRDLEIVGLVFDGNIESLPGDYIYLPEFNRAVAVDGRGILEALDEVYDADRIVLELTDGVLAATEAEADRARR
ncbi:MAG: S46 family peptidase [Gemmatimonadetes bacterium]|nr:S46 family peptidase [Gemmatimonadota bacterium]